ncbi:MAG: DinB family protein [Ferruginibacter sp.]
MNKQFEILKKTRKSLLEFTSDLTIDQVNEIPPGYNNNIAWNLGHLVASQQVLCYLCAGLPLSIDEKFYERYKSGTKPGAMVDHNELELIKQLALSAIGQFESDYQNALFANYTPWTNRYGIEISTIDDAIAYVIFHEGLHLGFIMALKHLVKK